MKIFGLDNVELKTMLCFASTALKKRMHYLLRAISAIILAYALIWASFGEEEPGDVREKRNHHCHSLVYLSLTINYFITLCGFSQTLVFCDIDITVCF